MLTLSPGQSATEHATLQLPTGWELWIQTGNGYITYTCRRMSLSGPLACFYDEVGPFKVIDLRNNSLERIHPPKGGSSTEAPSHSQEPLMFEREREVYCHASGYVEYKNWETWTLVTT